MRHQGIKSGGRSAGRKALVSLVRLVVMVAVLVGVVRWTGALESIGFIHPGAKQFSTPRGAEDVYFTTEDGLRLHGWFMRGAGLKPGERGSVVLHCHGNMESVDVHASWSDFLCARGISVFIFDYRGFGKSETGGRWLTRNDLMKDSRAALEYLRTRPDVDSERIGVYGVSLGGAFALALAAETPEIKCAATVNTFCSWPSVASDHAPVLGWVLIGSGLAQEDSVARLGRRPLLVVHSDRDTIVPYHHAGALMTAAERAGVKARLYTACGTDHLDVLGKDETVEEISEFFEKELGVRR